MIKPKKSRCWQCLAQGRRCKFHSSSWSKKKWKINPDAKPAHCTYLDKFGNPLIQYTVYEKTGNCIRPRHYGISQAQGVDLRRVKAMKEMRVEGAE